MKNKKTGIAVVVFFIVMSVGSVFAAMNWAGSENVSNIKDNLELIQIKVDGLESENNETIREIEILLEQEKALREQRERELEDKQTEIENKIAEIQEKNQEIDKVKSENNSLKQQLEQALRDVQEIERITEEMIN